MIYLIAQVFLRVFLKGGYQRLYRSGLPAIAKQPSQSVCHIVLIRQEYDVIMAPGESVFTVDSPAILLPLNACISNVYFEYEVPPACRGTPFEIHVHEK
jgi:hypothetical protein